MSVSDDIERYINFLRVKCRLSISLHPQKYIPGISERLMKFNLHCNDYCLYLKANNCLWADCIARQHKIMSILSVVLNVGYTECSYFSNVFKKNCGISPSVYRKQQHGG